MLKAIKNAFCNLAKPPLTHAYPATPIGKPKDYRGLIGYSAEHCIFCDKCEKTCPPGAILFSWALDGSKTYHYNPYLCIYCGDCVRACPKSGDALWQSETKAMPALKVDVPNDGWDKLEKSVEESKQAYKTNKASQKKVKPDPQTP